MSLVDYIPLKIVLLLASPYIAGKDARQSIQLGHKLYEQYGCTSSFDILGEDSKSEEDCELAVEQYCNLIDLVSTSPLHVKRAIENFSISFKPSMFCINPNNTSEKNYADDGFERIKRVVAYAFRKDILMTLDAESSRWTDFQLETYFQLVNSGFTNLGTVMQSRLFRSMSDINRFDERMRVRLVIGIYNEPADIAYTDNIKMKDALIDLASQLLQRGTYIEFASHDTSCIEKFFIESVLPNKALSSQFEIQFLLGVPRNKIRRELINGNYFQHLKESCSESQTSHLTRLQESGSLVRLYLPYGQDNLAGPYCKRRLKSNPNLIQYGIDNLLHMGE